MSFAMIFVDEFSRVEEEYEIISSFIEVFIEGNQNGHSSNDISADVLFSLENLLYFDEIIDKK